MAGGLTVRCPVCKVEAGINCKKPASRPGSHKLRIDYEQHIEAKKTKYTKIANNKV